MTSVGLLEPLTTALDMRDGAHEAICAARLNSTVQRAWEAGDTDGLRALDKGVASLLGTSLAHNVSDPAWALGADVACEMIEQCGWSVVEAHGAVWVQRACTHLERVSAHMKDVGACATPLISVAPLAELVGTRVMGAESEAHPEFHRSVTAPHIASFGHAILGVCESALLAFGSETSEASAAIAQLLRTLCLQVWLYASVYRTHVARLHALCMQVLFGAYTDSTGMVKPRCVDVTHSAVRLLSSLHLTGAAGESGAKLSQAQLWAATAHEMLDGLAMAVQGAVPSMSHREWGIVSAADHPLAWSPPSADYLASVPASTARCERLLGSLTDTAAVGIIPWYLGTPTPRAVPVPLARCVTLATGMMRAQTPPDAHIPTDQARCEATYAPRVRLLGVRFLVHLVVAFQHACWPAVHASGALDVLCSMTERAHGAAERLHLLCALNMLVAHGSVMLSTGKVPGAGIPLDPASAAVQRMARVSIQTMSACVVRPRTCVRPLKRARTFESDAVHTASRAAQDIVLAKSAQDMDAVCEAVRLYTSVFGLLATSAAPGHRDLARTGALALVGLAEVWIDARVLDAGRASMLRVLSALVQGATALVTTHASALVASLLPRVHGLLCRGALSYVPEVQAACRDGLVQVELVVRPRVPPLVDVVDSSALEDAVDAQDTVPLPVPGWQGPSSREEAWQKIEEAVPSTHAKEPAHLSSVVAPEASPSRVDTCPRPPSPPTTLAACAPLQPSKPCAPGAQATNSIPSASVAAPTLPSPSPGPVTPLAEAEPSSPDIPTLDVDASDSDSC